MCEFPITKKRPIPLARRIAFCIPALLLPAALAAQEPRQVALLRGQIGVDPEPGSLLAAPARLEVSRLLLADALVRLAERSRLQIAFSPTLLPEGHRVDCDCTALSTARALDRLLAGTDLGYVELGSQVVVVPRREPEVPGAYWDVPSGISAVATLTGVVRDSVHLEPVAFARVTVTPAGGDTVLASAISDRYGAFVVPALPASKPVRVEVRTLGHAWTRTYSALPAEPVRALLRPSPIGLEALDVLGSGRPGDPLSSFRDGFIIDTALLRNLPAMLDTDVGRATASSPSMSAPSDFTSLPYLRGGSSHGTPVLLDGVRLFNAFHFGGFVSAINPEVVKSAAVLAGTWLGPGHHRVALRRHRHRHPRRLPRPAAGGRLPGPGIDPVLRRRADRQERVLPGRRPALPSPHSRSGGRRTREHLLVPGSSRQGHQRPRRSPPILGERPPQLRVDQTT